MTKYAIGVDFGTESGRAVLVDVADGRQLATSVTPYRSGVIDDGSASPDQDVGPAARLGAPGRRRLPRRAQDRRPGGASARPLWTPRTSSASGST